MKQSFIQPKLPETERFIVPFGGSASILLNRDPSGLEVVNDLDDGIITFFKQLRDNTDELVQKLERTPYHEKLFEESQRKLSDDDVSDVDKAVAFFISTTMSYNAGSSSFAYSTKEVRRNRSQHTSRYQSKIDDLDAVAKRLQRVQFMNRDAFEIIEKFQKEDTLQHWDPPYPPTTRGSTDNYNYEMSMGEHEELLELALNANDGVKIAISSYPNELYDEALDGWNRYDDVEKGTGAVNDGSTRVECLYTNYDIPE